MVLNIALQEHLQCMIKFLMTTFYLFFHFVYTDQFDLFPYTLNFSGFSNLLQLEILCIFVMKKEKN